MAKIGSSQPPASPLGGRRIGSATPGGPAADGAAERAAAPPPGAATLALRLEHATLAGPLPVVPYAYAEGPDWETVLSDDVFAQLYLAAPLHQQITDAQVAANERVLAGFWQAKQRRLITGDRDLEELYRPGTIGKAPERLAAAAAALASAAGRAACFAELERRRQQAAAHKLDAYLRPLLHLPVLTNPAFKLALAEGESFGFTPAEAERHLLQSLRQAGYAPVKTINQPPNLLLAEWTPGGQPLTNRPSTKVMGHDVYSLAEAAQVLYNALATPAERDKAQRNLDSSEYLSGVAQDLRERDAQQDINDLFRRVALPNAQRRLTALYAFGPSLPFLLDNGLPAFASPTELLARTAASAADYVAAEAAYAEGLLPIWLRAAAPADLKAALLAVRADQPAALGFRQFLHAARPGFPLWVGATALATPAELAAYIRRDERSWEMVYGSLTAGYLSPWLAAQGQGNLLTQQATLADALLGPDVEPTSPEGRRLVVQALLQALEPQAPVPTLAADRPVIDLTGLSGEAPTERTLQLINTTGGPVWVRLSLRNALEGVQLAPATLFFDQRAPGQQLTVTLTGSPSYMPRDGQHRTALLIATPYAVQEVTVAAEAVFPQKQFWQFVLGSALAMAAILGGVRWLLGQLLGVGEYEQMVGRNTLLPLRAAMQAGELAGPALVVALVLLLALGYGFVRVLLKLAKPRPAL